tara:strand:+ start:41 stop:844 length:804 start_codon:yes stop_codon:yes gene_type:complete
MNIYQRVNEVRKQVSYIKKDAKVLNYKAVTHDAVIATIRPALIEQGIIAEPSLESATMESTGTTTKGGTPINRYEAIYNVSFVNMDEPQDRIIIRVSAHANDEGDKAPGKALSYAVKMAELKLFNIETGDNDESRIESMPMSKFNAETLAKFANRMIQALNEDNGFIAIGRSNIVDKDLWEATMSGTRKGSGYYSSNEKLRFGEASGKYRAHIQDYATQAEQAASNNEELAVAELLAELDNTTDKNLFWAMIPDSTKVFIKDIKDAA